MPRRWDTGCWSTAGQARPPQTSLLLSLLSLALSVSTELTYTVDQLCNELISGTMQQHLIYPNMSFVQLIYRMATSLLFYQLNTYLLSTYCVLSSELDSGECVQDTQGASALTAEAGFAHRQLE